MAKTVDISKQVTSVPECAFRTEILVRFADCDPAQMVFYPRFLVMFNDLVEDWFRDGLHLPFAEFHDVRGWGIPTVHLEVDFVAPCRLGEVLQASLAVQQIGRSSIHLQILLHGPDGSDRVRGKVVLVLTEMKTTKAVPIPDDLRTRMANFKMTN